VSQCQCQGIDATFDTGLADKQLRRFRRRGPQRTTRLLLDALRARGVKGRSLLDIGGGVGVIQHELLAAGVSEATSVDASSAYLAVSRAEADHWGYGARVRYHFGNFVELAPGIPSADIVTLDRVICCYDEMEALVGLSASRAARLYGVVYPRSAWWVRLGTSAANLLQRMRGSPFRIFSHATEAVETAISARGLSRVFHRTAGMWQVALFARTS
jgi:magnesium-protoporphyrin O-methyltransferase